MGAEEFRLATAFWQAIQARGPSDCAPEDDLRLREDRFQRGHMLGIYWETVGRWVLMRAKRSLSARLCA